MCYHSKNSSKYFSFCDTVFSSWGRSGWIFYLPYCNLSKKRKKKKKGTPPWYVKVGGHPKDSVIHGVGRSVKHYKRAQIFHFISKLV
jgi:hypothetical protein